LALDAQRTKTYVGELSEEGVDGVAVLEEGNVVGDESSLLLLLLKNVLRDLRKGGEEEASDEEGGEGGDGEVDVLNVSERFVVSVSEEVLGGDERSSEGSESVEGLSERETESSVLRLAKNGDVLQ